MRARIDWFVVVVAMFVATSCGGGGCGGCSMQPIPGGFPSAKRNPNAAQLRVSQTGLAAIEADPGGAARRAHRQQRPARVQRARELRRQHADLLPRRHRAGSVRPDQHRSHAAPRRSARAS